MKTTWLLAFALNLVLAFATPAEASLQGSVKDTQVTSNAFPVGTLTFPATFTYLGAEKFVLYGVADCEIHLFADVVDKRVKRLYWVQFEGYLEGNTHTYNYSKEPLNFEIGGHVFHSRVRTHDLGTPRVKLRAGSDIEKVMQMIDAKGLVIGPNLMSLRMVRLDAAKRKELMIIYSEDLADQQLTAADFAEGGKARAQLDAIGEAMRKRALEGMKLELQ